MSPALTAFFFPLAVVSYGLIGVMGRNREGADSKGVGKLRVWQPVPAS